MGCDIHCVIEYTYHYTDRWWSSFSGSGFNPGRNYLMFALLAGVRAYHAQGLFPRRGLPETVSWQTTDAVSFVIDDEGAARGHDRRCSREDAEKWVQKGYSRYLDQVRTMITNPDWHTFSWLTADELLEVLKRYQELTKVPAPAPYQAIHAALFALTRSGEYKARVVFWFDN